MARISVPSGTTPRFHARWRPLLGAVLLLIGLSLALTFPHAPLARSQASVAPVFVVPIHGEIDLGLAPYLARVLDEAEQAGAAAVILDLNTPGGRLDAALQMRQAILDSPVRTIAYVNRNAFSAGALLAIAANEVYMAPGGVIGAATPVTAAGETADEKAISAVRSTFRSTAEARGRDPRIAEAMVDPSIEIEGLVTRGQLLTLTTSEARARGYADGVAESRQDLRQLAGLADGAVREMAPALAEHLVRFITSPAIASLLIAVGFLLIFADLLGGGVGGASAAGAGLLAIFFWGHMLAGLAGWEGVALVGLGLVLLGLEAFVIPGFGIAGILGIVAFGAGMFLSLIGGEIVTSQDLARAGSTVGYALVTLLVGGAGLIWLLSRMGRTGGLILRTRLGEPDVHALGVGRASMDRDSGRSAGRAERREVSVAGLPVAEAGRASEPPSLVGARGVALSDLRPGGIARIHGERVDVVTRGDYVMAGAVVEVVRDEGYRRVVRDVEPAPEDAAQNAARTRP